MILLPWLPLLLLRRLHWLRLLHLLLQLLLRLHLLLRPVRRLGHKDLPDNRDQRVQEGRPGTSVRLVQWARQDLPATPAPLEALVPQAAPGHLELLVPLDPLDVSGQLEPPEIPAVEA